MHLHAGTVVSLTALLHTTARVHAAPQDATSLTNKIQAYLIRQNVNATIPNSVWAQAGSNSAGLSCGILQSYQTSDLVTPQDGQAYLVEAEQHWSPTAYESPSCIFEPTTIAEVQFAVGLLAITGTTYAIRSGGHSPFPGFASTNDGVLIAMHKMTTVEYDATTETVRLGMGNTWGDVYSALIPHNRIVVGGRLAPVGMALVTGGGLSHLSNEHGFPCDNVVNFEIVLANGTLVNANATSNSDLWFAMKAGQNNFGVTTHITTRAIESGQVWGGLRQWNASQLDAVADAFAEYQRVGQLDQKSSVIADLVPTNGTLYVTLVYFAPVNSTPAAFDAFYKIPAVSDNSQLRPNFLDLISVGPPQVVPRWSYGFSNLHLDNSETYRDVIELCARQAKKLKKVNGGTHVIIPQPISKSMIEVEAKTGGRPQGLRAQAQLWLNMSWGWNLAQDDAYVWNLIQETYQLVDALTKQRGLWDPYIFLNDAYPSQKVLQSYGPENFAKLKAVSAKYDPTGIFQTQVPGGFKLK